MEQHMSINKRNHKFLEEEDKILKMKKLKKKYIKSLYKQKSW